LALPPLSVGRFDVAALAVPVDVRDEPVASGQEQLARSVDLFGQQIRVGTFVSSTTIPEVKTRS
jgi:hypothetical protein